MIFVFPLQHPVGCRNVEVDIPTGQYTYSESTHTADELTQGQFHQVCGRNSNVVPQLLQKNGIARNSLLMTFIALKETFSGRQCALSAATPAEKQDAVQCGSTARRPHSSSEWSRLQTLSKRHSPQQFQHEKEEYFPSDPHEHAVESNQVVDGKVTPHMFNQTNTADQQTFHTMFSRAVERPYFRLKDSKLRSGKQPINGKLSAPVFADVLVRDQEAVVTLQYSMFFSYNGAAGVSLECTVRDKKGRIASSTSLDNLLSLAPMNEHEGDWVTVDVHVDVIADAVLGVTLWRYSRQRIHGIHPLQNTFRHEQLTPVVVPRQDLQLNKDGRVELFIAQNTHRVYTKPSTHLVYQNTLQCSGSEAAAAMHNSVNMLQGKSEAAASSNVSDMDVILTHSIVDSTGHGYEYDAADVLVFIRSPLFIGTEYFNKVQLPLYNHTARHELAKAQWAREDGEEWVRRLLGISEHGLERWKLKAPGHAEQDHVDLDYVLGVYKHKSAFLFQYSASMHIQDAVQTLTNHTGEVQLKDVKPMILEAPFAPWWTFLPVQWSNNDEQVIAEGSSRNVIVPYALKLCSKKLQYSKIEQVVGNILRTMPFLKRNTVEPAITLYFAWVCSTENHLYKQVEAEEGIVAHNAPSTITQVLQEVISGAQPALPSNLQTFLHQLALTTHEHDGLLQELLGTNSIHENITCTKHISDLKELKLTSDRNLVQLEVSPDITSEQLQNMKNKVESMLSQTSSRLHSAKTNELNVKKKLGTLQQQYNNVLSSIDGVSTAIHRIGLERQQKSVDIVKIEETERNLRSQAVQLITSAKTDEERKKGVDLRAAANDQLRKKEDLKKEMQHYAEEIQNKKSFKKQQLLEAKVKEESMKSAASDLKRAQRQKQQNSRLQKLSSVMNLRATLLITSTMNAEEQCKHVQPEEEQKLNARLQQMYVERKKAESAWTEQERTRLKNLPDLVTSHTLGNARHDVEASMKRAVEMQQRVDLKSKEVDACKENVVLLEKKYSSMQESDGKEDTAIEAVQKELVAAHVRVGEKQAEYEALNNTFIRLKEQIKTSVSNVDDLTGTVDIEKRLNELCKVQEQVWKTQYKEIDEKLRTEMFDIVAKRKKEVYAQMNEQLQINRNMLVNLEDAHTQSFLLKQGMEDDTNELKIIDQRLTQLQTLSGQNAAKYAQFQTAAKQANDKILMHKKLGEQKDKSMTQVSEKLETATTELDKLRNQVQLHNEAQELRRKDKKTDVSHLLLTAEQLKSTQQQIRTLQASNTQQKKDKDKLSHENIILQEDSKGSQAFLHNIEQSLQETNTKLTLDRTQIQDLERRQQSLRTQILTNTEILKRLQNKALLLQSRCEQAVAAKP